MHQRNSFEILEILSDLKQNEGNNIAQPGEKEDYKCENIQS